jgi:hypothetical protein
VPQGKVDATYSVAGKSSHTSGVGYHDHNWGNALMSSLINHWYWARGWAGPYTVVASYITAEQKYGNAELPVFLLTKDGQVIADDVGKVTFDQLGTYTDTATGKPVANVTRYTYIDGDDSYIVTFTRHRDLAVHKLINELDGFKKVAATLVGFDGAYLRFTGELRIEHHHVGQIIDGYADSAIWELMYLGSDPDGTQKDRLRCDRRRPQGVDQARCRLRQVAAAEVIEATSADGDPPPVVVSSRMCRHERW